MNNTRPQLAKNQDSQQPPPSSKCKHIAAATVGSADTWQPASRTTGTGHTPTTLTRAPPRTAARCSPAPTSAPARSSSATTSSWARITAQWSAVSPWPSAAPTAAPASRHALTHATSPARAAAIRRAPAVVPASSWPDSWDMPATHTHGPYGPGGPGGSAAVDRAAPRRGAGHAVTCADATRTRAGGRCP